MYESRQNIIRFVKEERNEEKIIRFDDGLCHGIFHGRPYRMWQR